MGKETANAWITDYTLRRVCAAVVAFCYFWLSTVVACQHQHHALHDLALSGGKPFGTQAGPQSNPLKLGMKASSKAANAAHCAACEWQASSIAPALPAVSLFLASPYSTRFEFPLPLCISLRAPRGSSRAPPLA